MNNIIEIELNNGKLYLKDKNTITLFEKVLTENFEIIEEYKNDRRTYVAKIFIDDKLYLLKKIFIYKKLKKIISKFKGGESLETLKNIEVMKNKGIHSLVEVIGTFIERKNGIIQQEIMLMDYCEGKKPSCDKELYEVIDVLKEVYKNNRYHGDCNPGNFIKVNNKMMIIDTKLKKMWFGDYRKHYDLLTLGKYFQGEYIYPYKKNIFYCLAYIMRKIRNYKNRVR